MYSYCIFIYLLVILSVALTCTANDKTRYKSYKNYKMYEVQGNKEEVKKFMDFLRENHELPYHNYKSDSMDKVEVMVAPELAPAVEGVASNFNLSTKTLVDDFSKLIEDEKAMESEMGKYGYSFTKYYDVEDMYYYIVNLTDQYPEMAQTVVIGSSYEGRPIVGLNIIKTSEDSYESYVPAMVVESGIYGREWMAPAATMYFLNQLMTSQDPDIITVRNAYSWYIFPVVNPDGYQYSRTTDRMWKKTRSPTPVDGCYGADMNRNFGYHWNQFGASDDPCDDNYAGSGPSSEPETKAISRFVGRLDEELLMGYIAIHGTGAKLIYPYCDKNSMVYNYQKLDKIGYTGLKNVFDVNGTRYWGPSPGRDILEEKISGTSMDWARDETDVPVVFTFEMRGDAVAPPSQIPEMGEELTTLMRGIVKAACDFDYC